MKMHHLGAVALVVVLLGACSGSSSVGQGLKGIGVNGTAGAINDLAHATQSAGALGTTKPKPSKSSSLTSKQKEDQQIKAASVKVKIIDASPGFTPYDIQVYVGSIIAVTNVDNQSRSFTAVDGSFDTGLLKPGQTKPLQMNKVGQFSVKDVTRPYVVGTVRVLAK